ncbi:heavy metal efflux pump, CzcA family [Mycolicibacterium brisbanense]|uniref:Heavy metal efflux pump, CzcA family n=1 Tax=Mycolicibacterium brisbanense TaxID=146020 RepID=A0A117I4D6_9MYCO|nr:heavy metal efflux pump, CzcA family [Mycolicibacterium brisbanense]
MRSDNPARILRRIRLTELFTHRQTLYRRQQDTPLSTRQSGHRVNLWNIKYDRLNVVRRFTLGKRLGNTLPRPDRQRESIRRPRERRNLRRIPLARPRRTYEGTQQVQTSSITDYAG